MLIIWFFLKTVLHFINKWILKAIELKVKFWMIEIINLIQ